MKESGGGVPFARQRPAQHEMSGEGGSGGAPAAPPARDAGAGGARAHACKDGCEHEAKQPGRPRGLVCSESVRLFLLSRWMKGITFAMGAFYPAFGMLLAMPQALTILGVESFLGYLMFYLPALWMGIQFLYNLAMTQHTDPGGTGHVKPTFEIFGQYVVFEDDKANDTTKYKQIGSDDPLMYAPNFCEYCRQWKPPRSHHCKHCKRCVLRMDHHCPFMAGCVGLKNHGHCFLMYLWAWVGVLYASTLCFVTNWYLRQEDKGAATQPNFFQGMLGMVSGLAAQVYYGLYGPNLMVSVHTILTCIVLTLVLSLGAPILHNLFSGQTQLEVFFPMKEYIQIKDKVYVPLGPGFWNQGFLQNVKDILGPSWRWRLLLPIKGAPLERHVGLAPKPSEVGTEQLLAMVDQVEKQGVEKKVDSCQSLGFNPGPSSGSGNVV